MGSPGLGSVPSVKGLPVKVSASRLGHQRDNSSMEVHEFKRLDVNERCLRQGKADCSLVGGGICSTRFEVKTKRCKLQIMSPLVMPLQIETDLRRIFLHR
jgi:hypothetical protein